MSDTEAKEAQWKASARAARLRYVTDDKPGITREALRRDSNSETARAW